MIICTIAEAMECVKQYRAVNMPSFLWGPPGIGKTFGVDQICGEANIGMKVLELSTLESIDLRGLPVTNKDVVKWIPPENLPNEKRDGKHGIFFLDEMNTAHPSIMAACMPLIQFGRIGSYQLPKGWYIVGAGNRQSDRAAAQRMPTALADRFGHIFVEPDVETWTTWANANNINPLIIAFIRFRPELLHKMDKQDQVVFPTPRSWTNAADICEAPDSIRSKLVSGLVGEGAALEYEAFYKTYLNLPTIKQILKDPKGTMVPKEPSAKYAISTALARHANEDNFDNVLTYAVRLDREFEIITALDATRRDVELCDHKAYIKFVTRNKDIQI